MSKKGKIILISVIIGIFLLFLIPLLIFIPKSSDSSKLVNSTEISKKTISNSISANGIVESSNSKKIYTTLSYPVKEIPVKIGDKVTKGQTICVLDSKELEKQIALKESSLNISNTSTYYSLKSAEDNYNNLKNSIDSGLNDGLNNANATFSAAQSRLETATKSYNDKKADINAKKDSQLISLNAQLEKNNNEVKSAETNYNKAVSNLDSDKKNEIASLEFMVKSTRKDKNESPTQQNIDRYNNYYKMLIDVLPAEIQQLRSALENAYFTYDSTKLAIESREKSLDSEMASIETELKNAQTNFDVAKKALESSKNTVNQQLENAKSAYEQALKTASNDPQVLELSNMKSTLLECTITAPIDGTITSITASEGAMPQGVLMTVEDTSSLRINASIKEYDINSIKTGMNVKISSDATGEDEYEGVVSTVSPAGIKDPTNGQINFEVIIDVNSKDTKLLVGLSTKLKIITAEVKDAYAVQFDSVVKNKDGKDVVFIAVPSGSDYKAEEVPVTVGLETDFELQISSDKLKDGTIIISDASKVKNGEKVQLKKSLNKTQSSVKD